MVDFLTNDQVLASTKLSQGWPVYVYSEKEIIKQAAKALRMPQCLWSHCSFCNESQFQPGDSSIIS